MDCNVDMSDPRWPSLREAARRFLREEGCTLSVPTEFTNHAWKLVQSISDFIPERINLPSVVDGDFEIVGFAQFGGEEPSLEICWIPECGWEDFTQQVLELLEAGYPGCLGCGGPGIEEEWNERVRRSEFLS